MSGEFKLPVPYLPMEIVEIIIDYLHNDKKSLAACSLVAHSWLPASRYHLISSVTVKIDTAYRLLDLLDSPRSTLPDSVRELKIISPPKHPGHDASTTGTLLNFTKKFAPLSSIVFMYTHWSQIDLQSLDHLRTLSVTKLVMYGCTFQTNAQFFAIVSLFQVLEDFSYFYIFKQRASGPYLSTSTISPRLKKLSVANEFHILPESTRWFTHKPLPFLHCLSLEEISNLEDVRASESLINHTGNTLVSLRIVVTRGYLCFPGFQPFLNLNHCSSLRELTISFEIVDVGSWRGNNLSFLPRSIESTASSSISQIKFVIGVGHVVEEDLSYVPWHDLDTIFANNSSFASLEKVSIEMYPDYILNDQLLRGKAEVVIYAGLERIARQSKLDVQYIQQSPPRLRFLDMHREIYGF